MKSRVEASDLASAGKNHMSRHDTGQVVKLA